MFNAVVEVAKTTVQIKTGSSCTLAFLRMNWKFSRPTNENGLILRIKVGTNDSGTGFCSVMIDPETPAMIEFGPGRGTSPLTRNSMIWPAQSGFVQRRSLSVPSIILS